MLKNTRFDLPSCALGFTLGIILMIFVVLTASA